MSAWSRSRALCWLSLGLLSAGLTLAQSSASAQAQAVPAQTAPACPQRDVTLNQAGVGQVSADQLDTDGDAVVLTNACFLQRDVRFDSSQLKVLNGVVDSGVIQIAGQGLSGEAQTGHAEGGSLTLGGLKLALALPSTVLGQLPLPQGRYTLQADHATFLGQGGQGGELQLDSATLTGQDAQHQTYTLQGAVLKGGQLTAQSARLGRVQVQDVQLESGRLTAASSVIGLCRDPQASQLQLHTGPLSVQDGEAVARDVRFSVFGSVLYRSSRLELPLNIGVGGSANAVGGLEALDSEVPQLIPVSPQVLVGTDGYGLRGLQFPDAHHTTLDLVAHANFMEAGVQTQFGANILRFGVFHDPTVTDPDPPQPLAEVALFKDTPGVVYRLALRAPEHLSDARLGYASSFGALNYRGDFGLGRQNGVSAAFLHTQVGLRGQKALGQFSLSGQAQLDNYTFGVGDQLAFFGEASVGWASGGFAASLTQDERAFWGVSPLPDLTLSPKRLTTLHLNYTAPDVSSPGFHFAGAAYLFQYDWLARDVSANVLSLQTSWQQPTYAVLPRASYDFANRRVGLGSDILLKNACFNYGVALDASVQPKVPGSFRFSLGLRFNLN